MLLRAKTVEWRDQDEPVEKFNSFKLDRINRKFWPPQLFHVEHSGMILAALRLAQCALLKALRCQSLPRLADLVLWVDTVKLLPFLTSFRAFVWLLGCFIGSTNTYGGTAK